MSGSARPVLTSDRGVSDIGFMDANGELIHLLSENDLAPADAIQEAKGNKSRMGGFRVRQRLDESGKAKSVTHADINGKIEVAPCFTQLQSPIEALHVVITRDDDDALIVAG